VHPHCPGQEKERQMTDDSTTQQALYVELTDAHTMGDVLLTAAKFAVLDQYGER
jgi:hypothetical protein